LETGGEHRAFEAVRRPFREHAPLFRAAWLNGRVLLTLDDADLGATGVARPVHRKAILVAIERLRAATQRAVARRSASGASDGLMSPTPDVLGGAADSGAGAHDDGSLDLHAIGVKRASHFAASADGAAVADVYLCTPCEGGAGLATILGAQLRDLGLAVSGHNTAHSEHATAGMLARGAVDFDALGYTGAALPSDPASASSAVVTGSQAESGAPAPASGAAAEPIPPPPPPPPPTPPPTLSAAERERAFGVDAARIGLIGFSKGGMEGYLAAAADPRIGVVVPCIGVQSFKWALDHESWRSRVDTFKPAIEAAARDEGQVVNAAFVRRFYDRVVPGIYGPFDGPAMLPLIAPRPLLVINGDADPRTPLPGVNECLAAARTAYRAADAEAKLQVILQLQTGHQVTVEARQAAMDWFVKWLRP
jgi:fermentation-respiration switch protein FrsA (DUF1100 family)